MPHSLARRNYVHMAPQNKDLAITSEELQDNPYAPTTADVSGDASSKLEDRFDLNCIARARFFVNLAIVFFGTAILPLVIIGKGNPVTDAIALLLALPTIAALYYWGVILSAATDEHSSELDWIVGLRFCVPVLGIIPLVFLSIQAARVLKCYGAKPGLLSPKSFNI